MDIIASSKAVNECPMLLCSPVDPFARGLVPLDRLKALPVIVKVVVGELHP